MKYICIVDFFLSFFFLYIIGDSALWLLPQNLVFTFCRVQRYLLPKHLNQPKIQAEIIVGGYYYGVFFISGCQQ